MSDEKKQAIKFGKLKDGKRAAVIAAAHALLVTGTPTFGLPKGVSVQTNAVAVTRFPLPLTVGSAVLAAIGVLALLKGHRIIGAGVTLVGLAGVAAAAAAPELNAAIKGAA